MWTDKHQVADNVDDERAKKGCKNDKCKVGSHIKRKMRVYMSTYKRKISRHAQIPKSQLTKFLFNFIKIKNKNVKMSGLI